MVYDSVGQATFEGSLECLRRRGMMCSFGEASGDPDPMPPRRLGQLGSIYLTHPSVSNFNVTRADLLESANEVFGLVASGKIKIEIGNEYALRDAPRAHADIEARKHHRIDRAGRLMRRSPLRYDSADVRRERRHSVRTTLTVASPAMPSARAPALVTSMQRPLT